MNRVTLSLPIALALALPLTALAQTSADADTAASAASDAASAASAPDAAASDSAAAAKAFEQWDSAERQRIADGRAAANARYEQDRRDCWQRFAVNDCLNAARDRRRATQDALRHDELILNAQERQRRTAARLDEIAHKQAESAARNQSGNAQAPASSASSAAGAQ
ncbi:MAG: hypothetical protein LBH10_00390 [Burkholderiaceae bacterium]|jgi:hypothetical protein|nr:hypothetical protein [Burkholderiaceae bacterium]